MDRKVMTARDARRSILQTMIGQFGNESNDFLRLSVLRMHRHKFAWRGHDQVGDETGLRTNEEKWRADF